MQKLVGGKENPRQGVVVARKSKSKKKGREKNQSPGDFLAQWGKRTRKNL